MRRKEPRAGLTVFNLDKIQTQKIMFVLHGKEHYIKPLTTGQFFEYTTAYNNFRMLGEQQNISPHDLAEGYYKVFSSVCPTLSRKDIDKSSQQQCAVIFGIILDSVTGRESETDTVKKNSTVTHAA